MKNRNNHIAVICVLIFASCNNSINYPDGGYAYPKHLEKKDTNFYYYPLKNILSRKDSFESADDYLIFKAFNEPNLSLESLGYDEFRLYYEIALGPPIFITVTKKEITVKKGKSKVFRNSYDRTKLSKVERIQYCALDKYYPFDSKEQEIPKYVDSLIALYPQMCDADYYQSLRDKMLIPNDSPFAYTTKKISITTQDFIHLVSRINASGYWKLPFEIQCEPVFDGYGYMLEANTEKKYNSVGGSCSTKKDFAKACQEIINYAHMDKEILIWGDRETETDTANQIIVEDVPLQEIKEPQSKHRKNH